MLQNYLKTAFRSLLRNKLFSAINVFGLAIGLAACILIMLFVRDEFSYDTYWANADRIYQVNTIYSFPGSPPGTSSRVSGKVKDTLKFYFPEEIEAAARFNRLSTVVRSEEGVFTENIHWADTESVDVFNLVPIAGDLKAALSDNASLAVNASFARKYFGEEDPIGQILELTVYGFQRDFQVAAVFEDLPHNTTLDFQALAMVDETDFADYSWEFSSWYSANGWLYLKLKPGVDPKRINAQLPEYVNTNMTVPSDISTDPNVKPSDYWNFSLQSLQDIQLKAAGRGLMKPAGDQVKVMAFITIAGLILLVACINFINLSTAKATKRAREVALRKVLGARRGQLIMQYLGESILLVLIALLIGLVLVELILPTFAGFLGKELVLDYADGALLATLTSLVLVVGVLAGVYPALVITGFFPAQVLKANKSAETPGSTSLRQGLVVFQFAISIGLIIATGVIYGQMKYATSMDIGYNKHNLLSLVNIGRDGAREVQNTIRDELARMPGVTGVAFAANRPAGNFGNNITVHVPGDMSKGVTVRNQDVDHDFIDIYEIPLIAGRNYDRARLADGTPSVKGARVGEVLQGTVVINERMVSELGYGTAQTAVGRSIRVWVGRVDGERIYADMEIIGVIKDMLFHRPRSEKAPEAYFLENNDYRSLVARFEGDPMQLVERIRQLWVSLVPSVPFEYEFVDSKVDASFTQERHLATLLGTFALLAVLIACLGLYGLASFTAERRTKEIGVRKVLGATVVDIVRLLVWQFSKPVLLANIIAWPVAAWAMISWLETFPYRMDFWYLAPLCLIAGMTTLAIAWATVGGNAAKVARMNPIRALRYE